MMRTRNYSTRKDTSSNIRKFAMASRGGSSKPTSKKSSSKKKSSSNGSSFSFREFFAGEKAVIFYGIILLLISISLFVSIFSFYFNAKNNISYVQGVLPDNEVSNLLNVLGAYAAYYTVETFFGIASIGFAFLLLLYAIRMIFKKTPLPLGLATFSTIITMAFLSFTIGIFSFNTPYTFLAGNFGNYICNALHPKIGYVGLAFMDLTFLVLLLVACYNFSFAGLYERVSAWMTAIQEKRAARRLAKVKTSTISTFKREDQPDLYITEHGGLSKEYATTNYDFVDNKETEDATDDIFPTASTDEDEISQSEDIPFEILNVNNSASDVSDIANTDGSENNDDSSEHRNLTPEEVMELEPYDPRKELSMFEFPPIDLLSEHPFTASTEELIRKELLENKQSIEKTLLSFGIAIKSISAVVGPTVTLYEIVPKEGVRISKIKSLEDDIALSLAALGIRIIAPIPGRGTIGIEVPNKNPNIVSMKEIITSEKFRKNNYALPIGLGKTINNESFVVDLAKMPHLLVAGATGQGKSVGLNAIITSLLYTKHPAEMKFVLVDPKKVEFTLYSTIENYYLAAIPDVTDTESEETIITDTKKVVRTLNSLCLEMDNRYDLLKKAKMRNIKEYNAKFCSRGLSPAAGHRYMPYIVVVIDEFGDLIMTAGREVEQPLARLAQLARAIGIHLVIATQRPSVNIITGSIKANFPARIAFRVQSGVDSKTILDATGANQLIGKGDMLISTGSDVVRLQCAFVDTPEVEKIAEFIGNQAIERPLREPYVLPYVPDSSEKGSDARGEEITNPNELDPLIVEAATLIVQTQQGSTSSIQRKMSIGYNRAGRMMDQLEDLKIVGPGAGSKPRQVLIKTEAELRQHLAEKGLL